MCSSLWLRLLADRLAVETVGTLPRLEQEEHARHHGGVAGLPLTFAVSFVKRPVLFSSSQLLRTDFLSPPYGRLRTMVLAERRRRICRFGLFLKMGRAVTSSRYGVIATRVRCPSRLPRRDGPAMTIPSAETRCSTCPYP